MNILIIIGILFIIMMALVFSGVFRRSQSVLLEGPLALSEKPALGTAKDAQAVLVSGNTGSLTAFVYPLPFQRTGSIAPPTPAPTHDATNTYTRICPCSGTNCAPCATKGFRSILNISNVVRLEVLSAPDASRQGLVGAQLVVRTRKQTGNLIETMEEIFSLPPLPFQKWTMLTIGREGRRFDVYYNTDLVLSKRTENMIDNLSAVSSIFGGDSGLVGSIGKVQVWPERLSQQRVVALYKSLTDTTGKPSFPEGTLDSIKNFEICPNGNCLGLPAVQPPSPLNSWKTSYA